MQTKCQQCGASVNSEDQACKYCGETLPQAASQPQPVAQSQSVAQPQVVYAQQPQVVYVQQQSAAGSPYHESWPVKSKVAAGVLAILFGGIGIHKFYLGKIGMGILYLLFCWTMIPALVGLIEGIIILASNDHNFQMKNHVRIE
jgi:TM2 domain-containing membrane protein YozV